MNHRHVLFALFTLLLFSGAFAYDLNSCSDGNGFNSIGNCILRGSFGGDALFFAVVFLLFFTMVMWQANAPAGAAIGIGLLVFFSLSSFFGDLYPMLLNMAILAIGVMIGLAVLHFIRR